MIDFLQSPILHYWQVAIITIFVVELIKIKIIKDKVEYRFLLPVVAILVASLLSWCLEYRTLDIEMTLTCGLKSVGLYKLFSGISEFIKIKKCKNDMAINTKKVANEMKEKMSECCAAREEKKGK